MLVGAALAVAGCGGSSGGASSRPNLTVSAAASLQLAFTQYGNEFRPANARFSFAGSDMLAAQIQQGVRPDVFASANTKLPDMLHEKGLVDRPVVFAANKLVLAVPANSTKVTSLADVAKPGVTLAIGSATVPIGSYTRTVLGKLPSAQSEQILKNVRSEEPNVSGIVGKLTQGAVDAGFLYVTDVEATKGKLKAIHLPASVEPGVALAAAVVKGAPHPKQAQEFINGLLHGAGQKALMQAGFLPPPAQ